MFNLIKSGMKIYKGKHATCLNLLWWVIAPLCAVPLVVGTLNDDLRWLLWLGLALVVVLGLIYGALAMKNEEGIYPWEHNSGGKK